MSIRPIIRKNARDSLRHHWGRAIGMLLFLICVNVLFLLLEQLFCYLRLMRGFHLQKRLYLIKLFIRNNSLMAFCDIILRHLPSVMANLGWK